MAPAATSRDRPLVAPPRARFVTRLSRLLRANWPDSADRALPTGEICRLCIQMDSHAPTNPHLVHRTGFRFASRLADFRAADEEARLIAIAELEQIKEQSAAGNATPALVLCITAAATLLGTLFSSVNITLTTLRKNDASVAGIQDVITTLTWCVAGVLAAAALVLILSVYRDYRGSNATRWLSAYKQTHEGLCRSSNPPAPRVHDFGAPNVSRRSAFMAMRDAQLRARPRKRSRMLRRKVSPSARRNGATTQRSRRRLPPE